MKLLCCKQLFSDCAHVHCFRCDFDFDMVCEASFGPQCAVNQKPEMSLECLIIDITMKFHKGKMVGGICLVCISFGTVYYVNVDLVRQKRCYATAVSQFEYFHN